MTSRLLDVDGLPFDTTYSCSDGHTVIELRSIIDNHQRVIEAMSNLGLVKWNENFGFAMAAPQFGANHLDVMWDNPERLIWYVGGWGPKRKQYIANAGRKLRPMFREEVDSTLDLRLIHPDRFEDKVKSIEDDGTFLWGDFPWGGAVMLQMGQLILCGAVSGLKEIEDDIAARMILGAIGKQILLGDNLLPS
jgi:hypothetical protein